MLLQDRAVRYLFDHLDQLPVWGDILQMAVLELIRKVSAGAAPVNCQACGWCCGQLQPRFPVLIVLERIPRLPALFDA